VYSEIYMRPDDDGGNGRSGYNEAVDVWSIGCLAGTLLTNAFLFPRERSGQSHDWPLEDAADLTTAFNLQFLDTSQDWQGASGKCKSFIKSCAMVDNSQRLTVAQALQHPWVAHPDFAANMHAKYAHAIADWSPRANPNDLIEYLKTPLPSTKAPEAGYEARLHEEVRSRHFPSPTPPTLGQFRTFNSSMSTSRFQHEQLSPIDEYVAQPKRPAPHVDIATPNTAISTLTRANANTNKRGEDEESSYLSIQDYAPPVIYPVSMVDTQDDLGQNGWGAQLAESMDLRQSATGNADLPRKKARI
jgi:serine/threonine protein kinase